MDLKTRTESFQAGNFKHLASDIGLYDAETITLDLSKFTAGTHFPNGFLPAGIVLGKVTATSRYGPYGGLSSEVQTITVDATAGTYTITFDGETTAAIAFDALAATVQAALELLSNVQPGDIVVTGGVGASGGGTPYTLTFGGQYLGVNVPTVIVADVNLSGGGDSVVAAVGTAGGSTVSDGRETPRGLLLDRVKVESDNTTGLAVGALQWHGHIIEANLPIASTAAGGLDAEAKALLTQFRFV